MQFISRKFLRFIIVVLAVTMITFLMVNVLPGDVSYVISGPDATLDDIEAIRKDLGLDRNIFIRYFVWLGNVFQGNLGVSYQTGEPVYNAIVARLPVTLELLFFSQCIALLFALPAGIFCAYRQDSMLDRFVSGMGFATLSIPSFVMALLGIYLFSIHLRWLPASGYTPFFDNPWSNIKSFVLPALSIALIEWVVLMRVLRSDLITTLQHNFILMARAKGLPPWKILLFHALQPSSLTLVTVLGLQIGRCIGEAVIVETVFALPGIGRLLLSAIYGRDFLMVQGCILLLTICYVSINSVVDVLYLLLDPRIRSEGSYGE